MCFRSIGVKSTFLLKLFQLLSLTLILQSGYAECCTKQPNVGLWVQAFGALTNQEADLSNYAYYTKASGGIYGLEKVTASGNIVGLAFANSNSNIYQQTQRRTIRMLGLHAFLYGTWKFGTDSCGVDWIIMGLSNKNSITTTPYRVASYRTWQAGFNTNFFQTTDNDYWQFTLIENFNFSSLYQPDYRQHNSSAARTYQSRKWSNVSNIGGGMMFAVPEDNTWLHGHSEIRFMGYYDLDRTIQETTASFVNSLSNFTITSNPGRWIFQTGVTYTFVFFKVLQLGISYDFELRTKYTNNAAGIMLKLLL